MLVNEFASTFRLYSDFHIWEIENIDAFFDGNGVLAMIFQDQYGFPVDEFKERRAEILESDLDIMNRLLHLVDDKHFFIFTLHDDNHFELIKMQQTQVMNFGVDIRQVRGDRVYVMIMDKQGLS